MKLRVIIYSLAMAAILSPPLEAQLRRPGFVSVEREDRNSSRLNQEEGAIYLEGMVLEEVGVRISKSVPIYTTLGAERWLGNLLPNQNAVLLAVSDKAYRVRARAKQGQVAGWISKAAVEGLPAEFEQNLAKYYERYQIVKELIDNHQVALGMSVEEVVASIGPPDRRSSKVTQEGRSDTLEYISYERVPRTGVSYNAFGVPVTTTTYVEVESGRVLIEFAENTVTSIEESEGVDLGQAGGLVVVPPPVFLF
ncbi:MAG: hypothetical protein AAGA96_15575 [Verrucomicrobiota bacterium]